MTDLKASWYGVKLQRRNGTSLTRIVIRKKVHRGSSVKKSLSFTRLIRRQAKQKTEARNPNVSVLKDFDDIEAIRQKSWTSSEGKYRGVE